MTPEAATIPATTAEPAAEKRETLTITDNRNGKSYEVPIENGTIKAPDLRKIKTGPEDFGIMTYDPAYMNTASCKSTITFIDGDKGILEYRGYPIAELAEHTSFLETAWLILNGELPTTEQHKAWVDEITVHTMVHENVTSFLKGFRYDAHPMAMLASSVAALSTFYPEAKRVHDPEVRRMQIVRLIAKTPTLAAFAYRHSIGFPFAYPDNDLSFAGNFLQMMYRAAEPKYVPNPVLERPSTSSSSCTPTTSRTAPRRPCARSAPPRSTRTARPRPPSRRSTARSTAAPTRPS